MNAIEHAIEKVGTPGKLAELLGVSPQVVWNWRDRGIPADRALDVERVTEGRVTAEQIIVESRKRRVKSAGARA